MVACLQKQRAVRLSELRKNGRNIAFTWGFTMVIPLIVNGALTWPQEGADKKDCDGQCIMYWISFSLYTTSLLLASLIMHKTSWYSAMPHNIQENFACAFFSGLSCIMLIIAAVCIIADESYMLLWWVGAAYLPYVASMLLSEPATFLMRADPSLSQMPALEKKLKEACPKLKFKAKCYHTVQKDDGEGGSYSEDVVTHSASQACAVGAFEMVGSVPASKPDTLFYTVTFVMEPHLEGFDALFDLFKTENDNKDVTNDIDIWWSLPGFCGGYAVRQKQNHSITLTRSDKSVGFAKFIYFSTMPFLLGYFVRVYYLKPKFESATAKFKVNIHLDSNTPGGDVPKVIDAEETPDSTKVFLHSSLHVIIHVLTWSILAFATSFMTYEPQLAYLVGFFVLIYLVSVTRCVATAGSPLINRLRCESLYWLIPLILVVFSVVFTAHSLWISVLAAKGQTAGVLNINYEKGWGKHNGVFFFKDGWVDMDDIATATVNNGCCRRLSELSGEIESMHVTPIPPTPTSNLATRSWEHAASWVRRPSAGKFTALASYPRSGSSLLRGLVENLTSTLTGSDTIGYPASCFLAEGALVGSLVRTHHPWTAESVQIPWEAEQVVVLVRSPLLAVLSLFHRKHTGQHNVSLNEVDTTELLDFARIQLAEWSAFYKHWLDQPVPKLIVHFEDLFQPSSQKKIIQEVAKFLGAPSPDVLESMIAMGPMESHARLRNTMRVKLSPNEQHLVHGMQSLIQEPDLRDLLLPIFQALGYNEQGIRSVDIFDDLRVPWRSLIVGSIVIGETKKVQTAAKSDGGRSEFLIALAVAKSASAASYTSIVVPSLMLTQFLFNSRLAQAYAGASGGDDCSCSHAPYSLAPVYRSQASKQAGDAAIAYALASSDNSLPDVSYCSKNGGLCALLIGDGSLHPSMGPHSMRIYVNKAKQVLEQRKLPNLPLLWSVDPLDNDSTTESRNLMIAGACFFLISSPLTALILYTSMSLSVQDAARSSIVAPSEHDLAPIMVGRQDIQVKE